MEGATDDESINALRERQKRNFIATLLLSQGVPMLLAGDELSHTQGGNNNTYCQDNELTWLDWNLDEQQQSFLDFVRQVARIWKEQPVFQRRKFFQGRPIRGNEIKDLSWFGPDGQEMSDEAWDAGYVKCLGVRLAGDEIRQLNEREEPLVGDTLLLLLNAHHQEILFTLPAARPEHRWLLLLDTAQASFDHNELEPGSQHKLEGRSVAVLRTTLVSEAEPPVSSLQVDHLRKESLPPAPPVEKPLLS